MVLKSLQIMTILMKSWLLDMTIKTATTGVNASCIIVNLKSMGFMFESDYEAKELYNQNDIIYEIKENFINNTRFL